MSVSVFDSFLSLDHLVSLKEVLWGILEALDDVFHAKCEEEKEVDVQRVRRLVAALVQRVERHTMHQKQRPKFGVHPCARGKESCPVCRYGFPHDLLERGGERTRKQTVERPGYLNWQVGLVGSHSLGGMGRLCRLSGDAGERTNEQINV